MLFRLMLRRMARRTMVPRLIGRRVLVIVALCLLGCLALRARAQADLTPGQQAMMEQMQAMQDIGMQMMQNIQNAGADPMEVFQGIGQQIQDGTFDPQAFQQQMVDKGYITPDMVAQINVIQSKMQVAVRDASLDTIKQQLNASDDEWTVLLPKVKRVLNAQTDVNQPANSMANARGARGMNGGGVSGNLPAQPATEIAKALKQLQDILKDPNASDDAIGLKLRAWRDLHEKARAELQAAQADLVNIVTLRQEALLIGLGIL